MAQETTRQRAGISGKGSALAKRPPWRALALAGILVLSAFLNLYGLTGEGYSNTYYAAAVKNMLTSWSNFFFVSYDAGFVTVDKPPLGLWVQAASAYLFGFSGVSLLLPHRRGRGAGRREPGSAHLLGARRSHPGRLHRGPPHPRTP